MNRLIRYSIAIIIYLLSWMVHANSNLVSKYLTINHTRIYAVTYGAGPVVIFESGLGDGIGVWSKVAPNIAQDARVVLYDRAGIEKSSFLEKKTQAHTAQMVVNNLQVLLKELHLSPPYILVGHSLGGLYMQFFAREFPNEVKGVVLVDSMSPYQKLHDPLPKKKVYYYAEALGISTSENQVRHAAPFPNVPLIVLSATIHGKPGGLYNSPANKKQWAKWQAQLASMSTKSQHITANRTGHLLQQARPWLVIAAIKKLLNEQKNSY